MNAIAKGNLSQSLGMNEMREGGIRAARDMLKSVHIAAAGDIIGVAAIEALPR
jgi:hypothetical protein